MASVRLRRPLWSNSCNHCACLLCECSLFATDCMDGCLVKYDMHGAISPVLAAAGGSDHCIVCGEQRHWCGEDLEVVVGCANIRMTCGEHSISWASTSVIEVV